MPKDIFALGERIADGCFRVVYRSKHYPDRVVKVTREPGQNLREASVWKCANRHLRKHLARVYAISEDGTRMLMERTTYVPNDELREHRIPDCINHDAHSGNFGRTVRHGRIVMHDYAFTPEGVKGTGKSFSKPEYVD